MADRSSASSLGLTPRVFDEFAPDPASSRPLPLQKALYMARLLQQRAGQLQTREERKQQTELDRMLQNPADKSTLMQLTDQAFRSTMAPRAADQLVHILDMQGVPRFFSPLERTLLQGFQSFGAYLPGVAVPLVKEQMRKETANVILPAEHEMLCKHLRERRTEGVRMNVNFLGEALLGEEEAQRRLEAYLEALQLPEIEVISVKISTIYSQISALARKHTVRKLCDRMELLYRAAAKEQFLRADGSSTSKFVYMDMEEYRDTHLTAEVFMHTLDRPGLEKVRAGIVLQAYVPDSIRTQQRLNEWARARVARGGAPITLRIVKGANIEMERVEASLFGWPQATFTEKLDTDANYKRMLHEGLRPENLAAVRLGVATHNLFEVAYALTLAHEQHVLGKVQFEMLEGMANHQRRALFELVHNLLLYAPACRQESFVNAIGYLVRRLDENTGPDNFLRHAFRLHVDSDDWRRLEAGFISSFERLEQLPDAPRRTQDRRLPPRPMTPPEAAWTEFVNEPDTDFSLPHNGEWVEGVLADWSDRCGPHAAETPLAIAGEVIEEHREIRESYDPSRPDVVVNRYRQATYEDVERAVGCGREDPDGWRDRPLAERSQLLAAAAQQIRVARGDLIGAAMAAGGKTVSESDSEVSEAVDFVEFYRRTAQYFDSFPNLRVSPRGVVVVVSPWNFPIAIPCGGVAAALAAGNSVILKPASDTVLPAYLICQAFWEAGVPRTALQFAPCPGSTVGSRLVTHPDVDAVILTGGADTALSMLRQNPRMNLFAETGGKNATIVTAMSDRDQAIKHIVHSAFSHSGQKCSATSLLILEDEVYRDEQFKRLLCDAIRSMHVGSAWSLETKIGPLIRPPSGVLAKGLKELETGESWAVLPRPVDDNPQLYSPGVKWNVQPGSFTHLTEFFGPVLAVMRARNLWEAIELVNLTGYGLTSGLESLDDREQQQWLENVRAGNLYVNRGTTGAIVLRQPFGGMGKSAFGPGIKAGGPNYVAEFSNFAEAAPPASDGEIQDDALRELLDGVAASPIAPAAERERLAAAIASYDLQMRLEYGRRHDHFLLFGQDNFRRYLPVAELRVRVHERDTLFDIFARVAAARAVGSRVTLSTPIALDSEAVDLLDQLTEPWGAAIEFVEETDEQLAAAVADRQTQRLRYAASDRVPDAVREAAVDVGLYVADSPVLMEGRVELLWYVQEQSISDEYHRYGNLGARSDEPRAEVVPAEVVRADRGE